MTLLVSVDNGIFNDPVVWWYTLSNRIFFLFNYLLWFQFWAFVCKFSHSLISVFIFHNILVSTHNKINFPNGRPHVSVKIYNQITADLHGPCKMFLETMSVTNLPFYFACPALTKMSCVSILLVSLCLGVIIWRTQGLTECTFDLPLCISTQCYHSSSYIHSFHAS